MKTINSQTIALLFTGFVLAADKSLTNQVKDATAKPNPI
jgi:hypothetical protein